MSGIWAKLSLPSTTVTNHMKTCERHMIEKHERGAGYYPIVSCCPALPHSWLFDFGRQAKWMHHIVAFDIGPSGASLPRNFEEVDQSYEEERLSSSV